MYRSDSEWQLRSLIIPYVLACLRWFRICALEVVRPMSVENKVASFALAPGLHLHHDRRSSHRIALRSRLEHILHCKMPRYHNYGIKKTMIQLDGQPGNCTGNDHSILLGTNHSSIHVSIRDTQPFTLNNALDIVFCDSSQGLPCSSKH